MDTDKGKIKEWKAMAELFLRNHTKAFVRDVENNFYFGDILFVDDDILEIECFSPMQRRGQKCYLYWILVTTFEEYKEGGK